MYSEIINGKEYRLVTIRDRSKLIAADGSAINPIKRNQKCTIHLNKDGYPCFGGGIPVHSYVAYGWVDGYFDGAEVNHIDFNRSNYNANNLEWVTHVDNVKYSANENHYAKPYGKENPNYGNHALYNKLLNNPELKLEYYSRPGKQNGRATEIYVYDLNMKFIRHFSLIKECAIWFCELFNKDKNKVAHIQSTISMHLKDGKSYKGYFLFKQKQ